MDIIVSPYYVDEEKKVTAEEFRKILTVPMAQEEIRLAISKMSEISFLYKIFQDEVFEVPIKNKKARFSFRFLVKEFGRNETMEWCHKLAKKYGVV